MGDLAEFLLARIAEDEAALDARLERVTYLGHVVYDPARVLAECEAKRRIVEEHAPYSRRCETCGDTDYPVEWPCPTLRLLALPYADHPSYREEWKP